MKNYIKNFDSQGNFFCFIKKAVLKRAYMLLFNYMKIHLKQNGCYYADELTVALGDKIISGFSLFLLDFL
jgi:hypothetical protein